MLKLPPELEKRVSILKQVGYRGGIIGEHRSTIRIQPGKEILLSIVLIPLLFTAIYWWSQDYITIFWADIFLFFSERIDAVHNVGFANESLLHNSVIIPYPQVNDRAPETIDLIWGGILVVFMMMLSQAVSVSLPKYNLTPLVYLTRIAAFIIGTGVIFFFLNPEGLWFGAEDYIKGCLAVGLKYILILPWIIGCTYNIFDTRFIYKLLLPALMMGYFVVAFPIMFLFHALVLAKFSSLYLPLLYLLFTFIPVMGMTIAIYSSFLSFKKLPQSEIRRS